MIYSVYISLALALRRRPAAFVSKVAYFYPEYIWRHPYSIGCPRGWTHSNCGSCDDDHYVEFSSFGEHRALCQLWSLFNQGSPTAFEVLNPRWLPQPLIIKLFRTPALTILPVGCRILLQCLYLVRTHLSMVLLGPGYLQHFMICQRGFSMFGALPLISRIHKP